MSGQNSDPDSVLFSPSDEEQGSFDSTLRTPEEIDSSLAKDSDNGWMSSGDSHEHSNPMSSMRALESPSSSHESAAPACQKFQVSHPTAPLPQDSVAEPGRDQLQSATKKRRFPRLGENLDGSKKFRLIVKSCRKKVFLRRMQATKDLDDDFYIPNRAKLILDFLKNHGDRRVRERNGPRQSFPSTLALLEHVMTASGSRMESILPPERGVCV